MKYRLAVFDLDGTILDTLDDLADSLNYALERCGYPLRTKDEVRRFVGNGIRKLVDRGVPPQTSEADSDRVFEAFREHYALHCADRTRAYDGIYEVLHTLRESGIKTAVVSNKADFAVQELCTRYFDGLFDAAAGERPGVRRKPAPDSVNAVLSALKIPRGEAVYIGDSEVDIETAANAEMDCISVSWGFRDRDVLVAAKASVIIEKPEKLPALILASQ